MFWENFFGQPNMFCYIWVECSYKSIKFNCSNDSFKATVSLLNFFLDDLSVDVSRILKSHATINIMLLSISPFRSVNNCFIYVSAPVFIYINNCYFFLMNCPFNIIYCPFFLEVCFVCSRYGYICFLFTGLVDLYIQFLPHAWEVLSYNFISLFIYLWFTLTAPFSLSYFSGIPVTLMLSFLKESYSSCRISLYFMSYISLLLSIYYF